MQSIEKLCGSCRSCRSCTYLIVTEQPHARRLVVFVVADGQVVGTRANDVVVVDSRFQRSRIVVLEVLAVVRVHVRDIIVVVVVISTSSSGGSGGGGCGRGRGSGGGCGGARLAGVDLGHMLGLCSGRQHLHE